MLTVCGLCQIQHDFQGQFKEVVNNIHKFIPKI